MTGASIIDHDLIENLSKQNKWSFVKYTENMAALMVDADIAIAASGASSLERCCLGLPSIQFAIAENQRPTADALSALGAGISINPDLACLEDDLVFAYEAILSVDIRQNMAESAAQLCDGKGVQRVGKVILDILTAE